MNLETATGVLNETLQANNKQDPDSVEFHKQWDEFGVLKGWHADCVWHGREEDLSVWFDMTRFYTRIVGDLTKAPNFTPGTHNYA